MREILFRGKRTDNGEWVEGAYYHQKEFYGDDTNAHYIITSKDELVDNMMDYHLVMPETIGQYTGLTDKNGTKIFEGDIIQYADMYDYNCYLESLDNPEAYDKWDLGNIWTIDEVVYGIKVGYPAFDLNKHDWEVNGLSNLNESGQYFYEVIDNIHDNPELLGGVE